MQQHLAQESTRQGAGDRRRQCDDDHLAHEEADHLPGAEANRFQDPNVAVVIQDGSGHDVSDNGRRSDDREDAERQQQVEQERVGRVDHALGVDVGGRTTDGAGRK